MSEHPDNDDAFRIASSPHGEPLIVKRQISGRGNGLVASGKSFTNPREAVIWIRRPLILILETSRLQKLCYQCLRQHTDDPGDRDVYDNEGFAVLKTCQGCQIVKYCSKKCQSRSWNESHKFECKTFGALHPRILPSPVRAIVRLLKQRFNNLIDDKDWEDLLALESHQDDLSNAGGERWQDVFLMAKAAQKYSGTKDSMSLVTQLYCILTLNSLTLTDPMLEPLGMALHPFAAMFNHSCDPNTIIRFDASSVDPDITTKSNSDPIYGSISVDILRPVPDGEELTISYIDNTFPYTRRQSELQSRYYFDCACSRCSKGKNTIFDKYLRRSLSTAAAEAESFAIQVLETCIARPNNLEQLLAPIKHALGRLAETKAFPTHRFPSAQLRLQLLLALLSCADGNSVRNLWYDALIQNAIIVERIDPVLYQQSHHPIRVVNMWRLFRIVRHLTIEKFEGSRYAPLDHKADALLKMAFIVSLTSLNTLRIDGRPEGTHMPTSTLDIMIDKATKEVTELSSERPGIVPPMKIWGLVPESLQEDFRGDWKEEIDWHLSTDHLFYFPNAGPALEAVKQSS